MSYAEDALRNAQQEAAEMRAAAEVAGVVRQPFDRTDRYAPRFEEEKRVTAVSGGQKGQKMDRQDLIDSRFIQELGLVCGFGARKYDDDNWRKGYSWRLSFGAMLRHLHAFWRGEEYDDESGLHHLAHAAWHCMVLFTFSKNEKYDVFDDRPC